MKERYEPASDFLKLVASNNVTLSGDQFADANLELLIEFTCDADQSNRDWATFLLAISGINSDAVDRALLRAAGDEDEHVRAEAISGLAARNNEFALSLVQDALCAETVTAPIFEAALYLCHPSLAEPLRAWVRTSDNRFLDELASEALAACEAGKLPGNSAVE